MGKDKGGRPASGYTSSACVLTLEITMNESSAEPLHCAKQITKNGGILDLETIRKLTRHEMNEIATENCQTVVRWLI